MNFIDDYTVATEQGIEETIIHQNQKSVKKVNTPFGYFGSKNKIALQLCNELPQHTCWVEAFCGSAALTLAKRKSPIEVINDIDGEVINVFEQLGDNQDELCRLIALTPYAKDELEYSREINLGDSNLERARKFLVQAMMAVNGVFGKEKGGFSYSQSYSRNGRDARVNRWYNLPERLSNVVERLRDVRIENRNAIELIEIFSNRPATLLYLDPPYLTNRTKGYTMDEYEEPFHIEMLKAAQKAKNMIFISGYENPIYNEILSEKRGWGKRTINTTTQGVDGNEQAREEIVWINKNFRKVIETGKLPLRLTKTELKHNKVNPERIR